MKRCKVIALIICSVVVVICTAMIIRINIQFPKAEDKSYTIDNPADIDGVIVKPLSYIHKFHQNILRLKMKRKINAE